MKNLITRLIYLKYFYLLQIKGRLDCEVICSTYIIHYILNLSCLWYMFSFIVEYKSEIPDIIRTIFRICGPLGGPFREKLTYKNCILGILVQICASPGDHLWCGPIGCSLGSLCLNSALDIIINVNVSQKLEQFIISEYLFQVFIVFH